MRGIWENEYLCAMFYRRKIILALLQACDGSLPKISLQKLLFLFANRQVKPSYDFVSYYYGCYSFSANAVILELKTIGDKERILY